MKTGRRKYQFLRHHAPIALAYLWLSLFGLLSGCATWQSPIEKSWAVEEFRVQTINGKPPHRFFSIYLADFRHNRIGRDEFLASGSAVGIAAGSLLDIAEKIESRRP